MTTALVIKSWRRSVLMLSTILLVLAFLAVLARGSLAGDDDDAARFVRGFGDQAIAMLSDPALDPENRKREFRHLLTNGFHLDLIGRDQRHRAVGVAHGAEGALVNDPGARRLTA